MIHRYHYDQDPNQPVGRGVPGRQSRGGSSGHLLGGAFAALAENCLAGGQVQAVDALFGHGGFWRSRVQPNHRRCGLWPQRLRRMSIPRRLLPSSTAPIPTMRFSTGYSPIRPSWRRRHWSPRVMAGSYAVMIASRHCSLLG